jgi:hypothetical protein
VVEEGEGGATVWSAAGLEDAFWLAGEGETWVVGGGVVWVVLEAGGAGVVWVEDDAGGGTGAGVCAGGGVVDAGAGVDEVVSSLAFFVAWARADAPVTVVGAVGAATWLGVLGGTKGGLSTGGGSGTTGIGGGAGASLLTTGA